MDDVLQEMHAVLNTLSENMVSYWFDNPDTRWSRDAEGLVQSLEIIFNYTYMLDNSNLCSMFKITSRQVVVIQIYLGVIKAIAA